MRFICLLLTVSSILLTTSVIAGSLRAVAEPLRVVASIKPVHSLVASVMDGVGEPELLVDGEADPHDFSLKPSQAKLLQNAQLVFWISPNMEAFLNGALMSAGSGAISVPLVGGTGGDNPHIWLDPVLTKQMVAKIALALAKADPVNAETYRINADALTIKVDMLSINVESALINTKKSGFLTYHDAFGYFENRYGFTPLGSIMQHEDARPGAARIRELRTLVASGKVTCILTELHANQRLISVLTENSVANVVSIDPAGSTLKAGPELYFQLMENVSEAFQRCLSQNDRN